MASRIAEQGHRLSQLRRLDIESLQALGIEQSAAKGIIGRRPPIDADVVTRLMHECRRVCCVCREQGKSLVLHHTREWAKSRRHDEEYLVVLCANCHGEAHTKRELGRNLTAEELLRHRSLWAAKVAESEAKILFDTDANRDILGQPPVWDYFNHRRIARIATDLGIDPNSLPTFRRIAHSAPVDALGAIDWPRVTGGSASRAHYLYDGDIRNADGVYSYFAELLAAVVEKSQWIDLASVWTPSKLKAVASPGRVAVLTAGFRFKSNKTMLSVGPGQEREGYYKKENIRLHFTFDGWETTSTSSRGNLSRIWRATAVCVVRSVATEGSTTHLAATCLGIGTGFGPYASTPEIAFKDAANDDEDVFTD